MERESGRGKSFLFSRGRGERRVLNDNRSEVEIAFRQMVEFLDEGLRLGRLPPTPFGYSGQDGGQLFDKRRGRSSSFSLGF